MNAPTDKIVTDAKVLAADVEELIRASAASTGERISAARDRAQNAIAHAGETIVVRGRDAAQLAHHYAKDNPWTAVGVAAGIGLLVGLLIGRR